LKNCGFDAPLKAKVRMKLLFITGCLEPGKDGVGDYTRELAAECGLRGYPASLMSLNDPWIKTPVKEIPPDTGTGTSLLRLGPRQSWVDRVTAARAFLAETGPDLVSLQLLLHSFHPAGLSFALPQLLRAIIGQIPVQVMFHELWLGEQTGARLKTRVFGYCQRKIIEGVVKKLACRVTHTSNPVYVRLLNRRGIKAKLLPLFGNVPIVQVDDVSFAEIMATKGERRTPNVERRTPNAIPLAPRDDAVLRLGIFGSIHPEWSPDAMFSELKTLGRPIQLSHIGRIGPGGSIWTDLAERYGTEIELSRLGERSFDEISRFLSYLDFGVATVPLPLIGKSSSVAAMLDHGLPVIVNRDDVHFRGIPRTDPVSDLLIPVDKNFLARVRSARRRNSQSHLPQVAEQFLHDIGA
jgi:glycosyltransferase involved in cell wall biosynthesis